VNGPLSTKVNFIGHAAPWFCLRTRVRRRTSNGRGWYTLGILLCGWNLSSLLHFVLICAFYRIEIRVSTFSGALQQRAPAARDETVQRPRNGIRTNLPALRFGLKSWHIQCVSAMAPSMPQDTQSVWLWKCLHKVPSCAPRYTTWTLPWLSDIPLGFALTRWSD